MKKQFNYKCKTCGKEITTLNEKQLSYLSKVHEITHDKEVNKTCQ